MSMQHLIKLLAAPQDLHELHIKKLKSQCGSSYKSELRAFSTVVVTSGFSGVLVVLFQSHFLSSVLAKFLAKTIHKRVPERSKSYLQYLTLSVQTNFRSLSGQLFDTALLPLKRIHPPGQRCITNLDLQMLKRDYLGQVIISSISEPSEAFQATTKCRVWIPRVQRIAYSMNKVLSPTMTPISTY